MTTANPYPIIIPRGEPFYLAGNEIAFILVHGFTDSPLEMRPFGEFLNQHGYTAMGIRVTGHATTIGDLRRSRWQDLLASIEDAYHFLRSNKNIKKIFIIGHSMGGGLTLVASSYLPMDGVIALAPAYQLSKSGWLNEWMAAIDVYAGSLKRKWKSRNLPERLPGWYWYKPELSRNYIKYNEKPIICGLQLIRISNQVDDAIRKISAPVLLMGAVRDTLIPTEKVQMVYDHLKSDDKELVWFEKSSHMLPIDGERDLVFERTLAFIQRVTKEKA